MKKSRGFWVLWPLFLGMAVFFLAHGLSFGDGWGLWLLLGAAGIVACVKWARMEVFGYGA